MNSGDNSTSAGEDRRLDLLVDGELGEPERRDLLLQLDRETGGWRRLALAFLEAQAWRQAMGPAVTRDGLPTAAPAQPARAPAPAVLPARRQSLPLGRLGTSIAMAASFLVAAVLGVMMIQDRGGLPAPGEGMVAHQNPAPQSSEALPVTAPVLSPGSAVAAASPKGPWRTVRMALPTGAKGTNETIELPAIERDRLDEVSLSNLPAALPPKVLGALDGRGYEVRQRRDLLPVNMQDGRGLVVPVDQVELHYVGGQKFQ